jgi:glycosyltransferase involved in cell wall biosynthesis
LSALSNRSPSWASPTPLRIDPETKSVRTTKIRVVFVTTVFEDPTTGPGVYARYLWHAFRDDPAIEFHVVAPSAAEKHPRLHTVGLGNHSIDLYKRIQRKAEELTAGREVETIVHGNACHSMWRFVPYPGQWLAQMNDYYVATLWHNPLQALSISSVRRFTSLAWRHHLESKVVRSASRVVCNSDFTRNMVLQHYEPPRPEHVVTIHKAVDLSAFQRPLVLPPDPFPARPIGARLVFVGSHWQVKGLHHLIDAIAYVVNKIPHVHLTVVGECTLGSPRNFIQLAIRSGVSDHILFVGHLNRTLLASTFFHSDIFVLPSLDEALGVAALEAIAAGLPVVASRVGGIPEIVSAECGVLCQPGDPVGLSKALVQLLQDPAQRIKLSRAGSRRSLCFSVTKMIGAVRNLYMMLLKA